MLIGSTLGNYRLVRLLGRGGYAEVYLGEHLRLGTQAAIKVLHTHLADHDDTNSFLAEARTVAGLEHPHIIRVLDFDVQQDGTAFLVMSYAANGNLRMRHPRGSQLSLQTTLEYVKQIADALQYAHNQRVIHRDLKPENMLLGKNDDLLLSDFGIALIAQSSRVQRTQEIIGTAPYMAPEQLQGKPRLESDQYTLGIITYEWLCGERPFSGSFTELYSQHLFVPPPSLREKVPTLPPEVEEVVQVALAKDPHQRFSSIQAFATALEQAGHTTVSASVPPATTPSRSVPPLPPVNPPAPLLSDEDYAIPDPYAPHPLPLFAETKEPSTSEAIEDHAVISHPPPLFAETKEPSTGIDAVPAQRRGFRDRLRRLLIQTLIATIIIIISRLTLSLGFNESALFTGWIAQFGLFFTALIFVGVVSGPLPALVAAAGGYFISNILTGNPLYWQNGLAYALVGCVAGLIYLGMQKRNASLRRRVIRMTITGWVLIIAARLAVYCMFIWLPPFFAPSQTTGEFLQQDLPASLTMLITFPLLLLTYNKYVHAGLFRRPSSSQLVAMVIGIIFCSLLWSFVLVLYTPEQFAIVLLPALLVPLLLGATSGPWIGLGTGAFGSLLGGLITLYITSHHTLPAYSLFGNQYSINALFHWHITTGFDLFTLAFILNFHWQVCVTMALMGFIAGWASFYVQRRPLTLRAVAIVVSMGLVSILTIGDASILVANILFILVFLSLLFVIYHLLLHHVRRELSLSGAFAQQTLSERAFTTPVALPRSPITLHHIVQYKKAFLLPLIALLILLGGIGAVYLEGNNALTMNDRLAAATVAAFQNRYMQITEKTPDLTDPLVDNSKGHGWSEGTTGSNATCLFVGSTYHIKQPMTNQLAICGGTGMRAYHDFLAQVQMTILSGDGGGIAFRTNFGTGGYVFYITSNGAYGIARSDFNEQSTTSLYTAPSSAIKTGLHQTNLLGVLVQGSTIMLFVNQHYLTSLTDNTYNQGVIALGSLSQNDATEVAFSQVELWQL